MVIESADGFYIKNADWVGIMGLAYSNLAKVQPWNTMITKWRYYGAVTFEWHHIVHCVNEWDGNNMTPSQAYLVQWFSISQNSMNIYDT